jgi:GNAT superfamily N-acetyltransferase
MKTRNNKPGLAGRDSVGGPLDLNVRLIRVYSSEMDALKEYIEALYRHDEDYDSMVNIEEGVKSLLRNENLANAYFIHTGDERVGYVILTRYHSVEKGGLTMYIDELYVEEHKRRHGIGRKIMDEILDIARTAGARTLWAQTETYNDAAQEFFLSRGFRPNSYLNFERPL